MLSALTMVAKAAMPFFLSASLVSFNPGVTHAVQVENKTDATTQSLLELPDQVLKNLNGSYTNQYYEDGELVTEVVYVEQLDRKKGSVKYQNRQSHNAPTKCHLKYPGDVMWFRHGWCYQRFHAEVQANTEKRVFAHVGIIDDNGRHTKTGGGWSAPGGTITKTMSKPSTCRKKCTVLTTYRTK